MRASITRRKVRGKNQHGQPTDGVVNVGSFVITLSVQQQRAEHVAAAHHAHEATPALGAALDDGHAAESELEHEAP